uniref:mRNA (guanine-N(7))-methyltransferase n=1 Tax=viral metagenome TaxID=1070528 RepID=A0A6C0JC56_9ZZZZ
MKISITKQNQIKEYLGHSLTHTNLEFETRIVPNFNSTITRENFTDVIKRLKGFGFENITPINNDILDINIERNNIRVSIHGMDAINDYCAENDLNRIKSNITMMEKKRFSHKGKELKGIDIRDYNFRANLKEEHNIKISSRVGAGILSGNQDVGKLFRYKKRISFLSSDKMFRFDLTMVKSSTKKEIKIKTAQKAKNDINNHDKKLVKKPINESREFNDWWQSLSGNSLVNLREDTYYKAVYYKNLEDSKTLENILEYEIEVELVSNDLKKNVIYKNDIDKNDIDIDKKKKKTDKNDIYKKLIENMVIVLQAIQKNEFVTSETMIKDVKKQFTTLTKLRKINESIPLSITLDYEKSLELDYEDYPNNVNIRKNYCVTEKADGERNLLLINSKGEIHLLNRQGNIKFTNCKTDNLQNCLLDGEYITKDKEGNNIRLFMIFDIYFSNGRDLREIQFMRTKQNIEDEIGNKSRFEELEDLLKMININKGESKTEFILEPKTFLLGDELDFDESKVELVRKLEETYRTNGSGLKELRKTKKDIKIFTQTKKIMDKISESSYIYKTDGLIFTPVNLKVGEGETKKNRYGGRWNRVFKWKPSTENSIDLRVIFLKDEEGELIECYSKAGYDIKRYYKTRLYCGYNPKEHNELNGLKVVNELSEYPNSYTMIPFEPLDPYVHNTSYCNLSSSLRCENGDLIRDNSIVEFVYDRNEEENYRWKPLRVRDNLMPNAFSTALNVWNTTFHPITNHMITTGDGIPDLCSKYYSEFKDRISHMSKVAKFHNLVKKYLIQSIAKENDTLLDFGTGEGGDLLKWVGAKLGMVVGIENNSSNISNVTKGACKRILNEREKQPKNELLKNIYIIWGDASKNLKTNESGNDELNKYYMDVLWGNTISDRFITRYESENMERGRGVCADGFNMATAMFSMHYFFENDKTLFGFLQNLSDNLKVGSQFVACLFDGSKIFDMLKSKDVHEQHDKDGKLCWSIRKKYSNTKLNNNKDSLGMTIGVYVNTFHKEINEYLVNLDYLESILPKFGLAMMGKTETFKNIYNGFSKSGHIKEELSNEGQLFSFLNVAIKIIKKENIMFGGGNKDSTDLLSNFISNDFTELNEDEEDEDDAEDVEDIEDDEDVANEEDIAIAEEDIANEEEDIANEEDIAIEETKELDISIDDTKELDIAIEETEEDIAVVKVKKVKKIIKKKSEQNGGSKELDVPKLEIKELELNDDLDLNEIDIFGSKDLDLNETDIFGSKDLDVPKLEMDLNTMDLNTMDLNTMDNLEIEELDLNENNIDFGSKPDILDLNIDMDEGKIGNSNVKVIKINADDNTLNMINK